MGKADRLRDRRLNRMRLGQAACDVVPLVSDPENSVKIVPLVEAEYLEAIEAVAAIIAPDNLANLALRDRRQSQEILVRSIREDDDLTAMAFSDVREMMAVLEVADVDEIIDRYNEMIHTSSPSVDGIPPEELDAVKKGLQEMEWSELSGRSWYALKRFLSTLPQEQLLDNLRGFGSTNSSTTTSE